MFFTDDYIKDSSPSPRALLLNRYLFLSTLSLQKSFKSPTLKNLLNVERWVGSLIHFHRLKVSLDPHLLFTLENGKTANVLKM